MPKVTLALALKLHPDTSYNRIPTLVSCRWRGYSTIQQICDVQYKKWKRKVS